MLNTNVRQAPAGAIRATATLPLADRLAAAMIDHFSDFSGCTRQTLLDEGFSDDQLTDENLAAARRIANDRFVKMVEGVTYNRAARVREAGLALIGLMPNRKVILATLGAAGFNAEEADDLFAEACAWAGAEFAVPDRGGRRSELPAFELTYILDSEQCAVTVRAANAGEAEQRLAAIVDTGRVRPIPQHPAEAH